METEDTEADHELLGVARTLFPEAQTTFFDAEDDKRSYRLRRTGS